MGADIDSLESLARKSLPSITRNGSGGYEVVLDPTEHRIARYNDLKLRVRFRKSRSEPLRWEMQEVYYLVSTGEVMELAALPSRIDDISQRMTPHAKKYLDNWNSQYPDRFISIESFAGIEKVSVEDIKAFIERRDGK